MSAHLLVRGARRCLGWCIARLSVVTRLSAVVGIAVLLLIVISAVPARADDVVSDYGFIRVNIDHRTVRLEMLVVKPADARGRLPVAILNHGRPGTLIEASDQRLTHPVFRLVLEDMARRGWLGVAVARRGYGLSDGPSQTRPGCQIESAMSWMNTDADDIQAALDAIAKRPDADSARIMSFGMSAGGGASVALSARNPPGLAAVINIDGGEHNENCALIEQSIPIDFKAMGALSRVPNLWLFAKNDSLHPPAQVEVMRGAFAGAGGDVKLVEFDPIVDEGHTFSQTFRGRRLWLPVMDEFLRARHLPTWTDRDVDRLLQGLHVTQQSRAFVADYLAGPSQKALAQSTRRSYMSDTFALTIEEARKGALQSCEAKAAPCVIVMENNQLVSQPRGAASR
jgi:dienelactone hydrolase